MIVTPIPHGLNLLKSDLVRSSGLHASEIYGDLFKELEPNRYDIDEEKYPPATPGALMALGTAWEVHFEKLLALNGIVVERPGEFMSPEGIAFSPDLIQFNGVTRLWEIKLSSMSAEDLPTEEATSFPPKFDKYQTQLKLYAYWLGLHDGCLAFLSIRKPWDPDLRLFQILWTDHELQMNARMCLNYARHKGLLT